jgi:mono/diheme cytochrome c family protein
MNFDWINRIETWMKTLYPFPILPARRSFRAQAGSSCRQIFNHFMWFLPMFVEFGRSNQVKPASQTGQSDLGKAKGLSLKSKVLKITNLQNNRLFNPVKPSQGESNQFGNGDRAFVSAFHGSRSKISALFMKGLSSALLLGLLAATVGRGWAGEPTNAPVAPPPVPYLTAEEEAKTFVLPPGYRMELVVGDPIIREPVVAAFDGNGRMFVAEMRSYMQDIEGQNEHTPVGRVSLHWSSRHNGVYDRHTIFVDHLVLPRMILPVADGLLVNETDTDDIWLYRDTHGIGVADKKTLVYHGGPRGGNLEHQPSGLIWDRDNWIYQAANAFRLRLQGTNMVREPTPANGGQWGLSQDDYGKLWFVNASGELGPVNFQEPILYGAFNATDEPTSSFMEVWPLVGLADVQGGPGRFRPTDKTLNHLTACCGPDIFRGDRLPADLRGNLLFGEPVGRLVRRARIEVKDGITHLINPYQKSEFLRSTDPNFRPVNMVTAPDGTLYIVDMYRGIIQEADWVRSDSYLRKPVQLYQLEKNFGRGRIWRLRHQDFRPGPQPWLLDEKSAKLVADLAHPNGWWRDTAQKLLVLRGDRSVVPALSTMARSHPNPLARINALWTLEGLNALDPALVREKLKDPQGQVRVAAIRVSETLYKQGGQWVVPDVSALAADADPNVVIQAMLTANLLKWPRAENFIQTVMSTNQSEGVQEFGRQMLGHAVRTRSNFTAAQRSLYERGEVIYKQLCFACHGTSGEGMPLQGGHPGDTMAPPLAGSTVVNGVCDGLIDVVLKGLNGRVDGKSYTALMVPMESNNDDWVAAVTSYLRNSFGNNTSFVSASDVARARAAAKIHNAPWTLEELQAVLPQPLTNRARWKVSASDNSQSARLAIDGDIKTRYDTSRPQVPGMWFQIELPEAATISGLRLDAGNSFEDYPRGYKVELSDDGRAWGQPVAMGQGSSPVTDIFFPPARGKFIRIAQTGSVQGLFWSIHELNIFTPGAPIPRKAVPGAGGNPYE